MSDQPERIVTKKTGLTLKETAFVTSYCRCLNGSKAAKEAGYSVKRSRQTAHDMLHREPIKEAVRARIISLGRSNPDWQEAVLRFGINALEVTPYDFLDAQGEPLPADQIPDELKACLQSLTSKEWTKDGVGKSVTIRLHNKVTVAALMAKILGMDEMEDAEAKSAAAIKDAAGTTLRSKLSSLAEHRRKRSMVEQPLPGGAGCP